jgi:UDPglucose--hexose-1-phosphate uridylyltransferase
MSEFREDPVSGDWVIVAPERAKRPEDFLKPRAPRVSAPKHACPFEDLEKSGNPPIARYPDGRGWRIAVIPNKYPAVEHLAGCAINIPQGLYHAKTGVGDHEIVVTRDHRKSLSDLSAAGAAELFSVFQKRHRALAKDRCNAYISTFFNWGPGAGASLSHPHYQTLGLPIVPPHTVHSLHGAEQYYKKHRRCVRCDVIATERAWKKRVIAENRSAIAIAPYAGKRPFEVAVLPKRHEPSFGKTAPAVMRDTALIVQSVLQRMKKYLHDPDLNLYIHGAPVDGRAYPHHHWHVEVIPVNVVSPPGGFEMSTVVNINVIDPETAAAVLRGEKIT